MTLSKLSPTTIAVSLVAFLSLMASSSPPVLSLDTGYDYGTNEKPTTAANLYGHLKCAFLFAGMTHMRLMKLAMDDESISPSVAVDLAGRFNVRTAICTLYGEPADSNGIQTIAANNCDGLDGLLDANKLLITTYGTWYEALESRQLLLDNLGTKISLKTNLMAGYDLPVNLDRTAQLLKEDCRCASRMYSPAASSRPLFSIKRYYSRVFSLFKSVMYWLTLKHLLYVIEYAVERRAEYFGEWQLLLMDFQRLLGLQRDPDVVGLLDNFQRLVSGEVGVYVVIGQLQGKLTTINDHLQGEATKQSVPKLVQYGKSIVDTYSLGTARAFIDYIKSTFQKVDFDVIRSIVTYLDDDN